MGQQSPNDLTMAEFQRIMAQMATPERNARLPDTRDLMARQLTSEELLGFVYALDCIRTWAAQLEASATKLSANPADGQHLSPQALVRHRAQFTGHLAEAMQLGFYG